MRGHEPIIAMRQAGRRPEIVFMNDYPDPCDWSPWGGHATVCVDGDTPELLDLRFVVGLRVSITGATVDRAKRLMQACKDAGAVLVGAGAPELVDGYWQGQWSEVWAQQPPESIDG